MQAQSEKPDLPFLVAEPRRVYEFDLQHLWSRTPRGLLMRDTRNREITVLSPGTWNVEAGPDFKNARIRIGGKTVKGDIEVHYRESDWIHHGHQDDPNYENVILHLVTVDDLAGKNSPCDHVVIINAENCPPIESDEKKFPAGRCASYFSSLNNPQVAELLVAAGRLRFRRKTEHVLEDMLTHGAEPACLKMVFDAAGFKRNRESFAELFNRFMAYSPEDREKYYSAILWGESGLLPDPAAGKLAPEMSKFVESCWKDWWKLRQEPHPDLNWRRDGVRPLNFPERRLAALTVVLEKTGANPVKFLKDAAKKHNSPEDFQKFLVDDFTCHHPLWDSFTGFSEPRAKSAAVFGTSRSIELSVNALLPALTAYGRLKSIPELSKFAEKTWFKLPSPGDNRLIKTALHRWLFPPERIGKLKRSAAVCQGIIHLYREYCESAGTDCAACLLYNSI